MHFSRYTFIKYLAILLTILNTALLVAFAFLPPHASNTTRINPEELPPPSPTEKDMTAHVRSTQLHFKSSTDESELAHLGNTAVVEYRAYLNNRHIVNWSGYPSDHFVRALSLSDQDTETVKELCGSVYDQLLKREIVALQVSINEDGSKSYRTKGVEIEPLLKKLVTDLNRFVDRDVATAFANLYFLSRPLITIREPATYLITKHKNGETSAMGAWEREQSSAAFSWNYKDKDELKSKSYYPRFRYWIFE